ncbi:MAG: formate dehydrogenase accessory sulfurtransferase FdhD [Paludibacterium sp.]|uniref:formate dehydrogenase accessory sulfurtransferase FdhD n=1 Tax=Paludibacterium sp. TaxID=1917523 RepID=UPI0025DD2282|nr:formate dehydrogenase accessory sulfurtransferase FdhD [Paludibacterium sp.]MBV8047153.1 formate dehydrogenase accessory sulfurtransferase FdhD [Paludibacterium sp.]MBV8647408.1 formate dehydrogenase accessory sulfurtransferase FdhD [Paludibacterium sp.]
MSDTTASPPLPGSQSLPVVRHRQGTLQSVTDLVAEECPVALVFNGISHAVMMATPADLDHFALGFALSEGIVDHVGAVRDIEVVMHADSAEVQMEIAQGDFVALKAQRRALAGRTGCGVCGIESIELLDLAPPRIGTKAPAVDETAIARILEDLPSHQPLMRATGCAHGAAWCTPEGDIVRLFEDVGRHNALDKLLGWMAREAIAPDSGLVFLTSRASYELVRKAARRDIALIATISAPTSLAVRIAVDAGITLLSFCRANGFVAYGADGASA